MPQKELERLQAVHRFLKLEFNKQEELQEIVKVAAQICATPTSLITFVDKDTQYIKFRQGFDFEKTLRRDAFCNLVVEEGKIVVIPDALVDQRFSGNPMVTGDPYIRFYAGVPLITMDGQILGSLCVIDQNPGTLTENQGEMLKILAKQVVQLMDFGESLRIMREQYIEAKHSEIQLRSFFESSVDHHLLLGKNFEILAFNKTWENHVKSTYGLQLEKGKSMVGFIHQDLQVRLME